MPQFSKRHQSYRQTDAELGECLVVTVRPVRNYYVALYGMFVLLFLWLTNVSLGPPAEPMAPAVVKLSHNPYLAIPLAALACLEFLRNTRQLVALPTELSVSDRGFRMGYLTHSRVYEWSEVARLTKGPYRSGTLFRGSSSAVVVELADAADQHAKRLVSVPADGPWPGQRAVLDLLIDGQMGENSNPVGRHPGGASGARSLVTLAHAGP
jgi:hypothetical protein